MEVPAVSSLQHRILLACSAGDLSQVKVLHAQLQSADKSVLIEQMVEVAANATHEAIVTYCLSNGADCNNRATIMAALNSGSIEIYKALISAGLDPNRNLDFEGNALLLCTSQSDLRFVKFLVENGADPNNGVRLFGKDRILEVAAQWASIELFSFLLSHGCPLKNSGALQRAALMGRTDMVIYLIEMGAGINEFLEGQSPKEDRRQRGTALHEAVEGGNLELVRLLLARGADVSLVDSWGKTAVERVNGSTSRDGEAIVSLLREYQSVP